MEKLIEKIYKKFCKETGRNGGVLVHSSITEWNNYLAKELRQHVVFPEDVSIKQKEG